MNPKEEIKKINEAVSFIKSKFKETPSMGIVLGSGLGDFAFHAKDKVTIAYKEIPHFKTPSVAGHSGQLVLGSIENKNVAILQGRLHPYEGHKLSEVVFPIRVLAKLGISSIILTNASGGFNSNYQAGDLVCINDHINMMGKNPLIGENLNEIGPRFPDMTHTYNPQLLKHMEKCFNRLKIPFKTGVYCSVLGPSYETPAEVKMLKTLGGDLVGMSTVPESIAAHHAGLKVAGISCITNMAAGISLEELNHEDVKAQAAKARSKFSQVLLDIISTWTVE